MPVLRPAQTTNGIITCLTSPRLRAAIGACRHCTEQLDGGSGSESTQQKRSAIRLLGHAITVRRELEEGFRE